MGGISGHDAVSLESAEDGQVWPQNGICVIEC